MKKTRTKPTATPTAEAQGIQAAIEFLKSVATMAVPPESINHAYVCMGIGALTERAALLEVKNRVDRFAAETKRIMAAKPTRRDSISDRAIRKVKELELAIAVLTAPIEIKPAPIPAAPPPVAQQANGARWFREIGSEQTSDAVQPEPEDIAWWEFRVQNGTAVEVPTSATVKAKCQEALGAKKKPAAKKVGAKPKPAPKHVVHRSTGPNSPNIIGNGNRVRRRPRVVTELD